MAEANDTRPCNKCGTLFEQRLTQGRPFSLCAECRGASKYKKVSYPPRPCQWCGDEFKPSRRVSRFCTSRCTYAHRDSMRPGRDRRGLRVVACHGCGSVVMRRASSGEVGRYCSRKCNTETMTRVAKEVSSLRAIAGRDVARVEQARALALVKSEVLALRRIASYVEKPRAWAAMCMKCDSVMVVRAGMGRPKAKCQQCAESDQREWRRISKSRRRAVERGASADRIDPIKVFQRDKWRCHMCGREAPKSLRGTHDPKAPELDHIVTLSEGGTHTWGNVACACRECNINKGGASRGQLGLRLAV